MMANQGVVHLCFLAMARVETPSKPVEANSERAADNILFLVCNERSCSARFTGFSYFLFIYVKLLNPYINQLFNYRMLTYIIFLFYFVIIIIRV